MNSDRDGMAMLETVVVLVLQTVKESAVPKRRSGSVCIICGRGLSCSMRDLLWTLRFFGVCYVFAMSETVHVVERDPRYPVGKSMRLLEIDENDVKSAMTDLAELPGLLRQAVDGLDAKQLHTPYREGGWTVQQLVHHLADSHMNAFIRVRLALTEENPTISPYKEAAWAQLHDSMAAPLHLSLDLLEGLHARWILLLHSMDEAQ